VVGALALTLALFYRMAFTDHVMIRGDIYTFFYPLWDARHEALRAGELPSWSPYIFLGVPLLAEPQTGVFYPPNWLVTGMGAVSAVKVSLWAHAVWAMLGALLLFRATTGAGVWHASTWTAGILFAWGGVLGGHVEQINQYQGIAWMGWVFWLWHSVLIGREARVRGLLLACALAWIFFSGHTQTLFMIGVGMGLFALAHPLVAGRRGRAVVGAWVRALGVLAVVGVVALLLALPQIIPTLELVGISNRSGFNANQATAFSLPPHYLGWSLLPNYESLLFTEYLSTVGVIGLGLAGLALVARGADSTRWLWAWLAGAGLFLALGRSNPVYYNMLAELPGFDLFRVPSRWMALFALGVAMLGGLGVRALAGAWGWRTLFPLGAVGVLAVGTAVLPRLFPSFAPLPEDVTGTNIIGALTLLGWGVGLVSFVVLAYVRKGALAFALVALELWLASQVLPFNDLAPRDVVEGQRFSISQLQAYAEGELPPARILPIGRLLFDVGEREMVRAYFEAQGMGEEAIQYAFTALKRQELVNANLPMRWGIHSADGYGGGLLPHTHYTQWSALVLPDGTPRTLDGRLGEMLARETCYGACIPADWVLAMMDVRYLLMDKTHDPWIEGVAYDLAFPTTQPTLWRANSPFEADTVRVLHRGGDVSVMGGTLIRETSHADGWHVSAFAWQGDESAIDVRPNGTTVYAVSLTGAQAGVFQQTTPPTWERALSSEIKLYRALTPRARAFVAQDVRLLPDTWQGSEDAMRALIDDPTTPIIHSTDAPRLGGRGQAEFVAYRPHEVRLRVTSDAPAYLILREATYEGWQVSVNGQTAPVYRADVLFRAVPVPEGESEVVLTFAPPSWGVAFWIGGMAWVLAGVVGLWLVYKGRQMPS
jgi:hypothetical protein